MITSFPNKPAYNPGGSRDFEFAHVNSIQSFLSFSGKIITEEFLFYPGYGWLSGYATSETLNFKETGIDGPNGPSYDQEITGFCPGDKPELIDLIEKMEGQPFIVKIRDAKGQMRVAGSYGFPLIFTADFDSGSAKADSKGFKFSFKGKTIFRAPVYNI